VSAGQRAWLGRIVPPVAVLVLVGAVWQGGLIHAVFHVREFTLPYLSSIGEAAIEQWSVLAGHARTTLIEAGSGYAIGSTLGFLLAVLFVRFPNRVGGLPGLMSGLNATPIVALAPVAVLWFGTDIASKIAVVILMTMAPMAVSTTKGLGDVDPAAFDLMESYAAKDRDIIRRLRIPSAMPYVFTALKLNVTLALIGAIIAEFFSALGGLGFFMNRSLVAFDMAVAWSTMALAGLFGVVAYLSVEAIERVVIPWHSSIRRGTP
jgi:NitT/TauT family transport system permease protein